MSDTVKTVESVRDKKINMEHCSRGTQSKNEDSAVSHWNKM